MARWPLSLPAVSELLKRSYSDESAAPAHLLSSQEAPDSSSPKYVNRFKPLMPNPDRESFPTPDIYSNVGLMYFPFNRPISKIEVFGYPKRISC